MRKRVYIAGPITKGDMLANVRRADTAMFALMRAGLAPLNPILSVFAGSATRMTRVGEADPIYGVTVAVADASPAGTTHEDWMGIDLPWVGAADAVLRLPGESVGADRETAHADCCGIPVFHTTDAVIAWAKGAE